jgi:asparagine synthase (glutamine-hydrolyzing)
MCGIFGFTGYQKEYLYKARQALNMLAHRGPDQWGEWTDDDIYSGHRRLSINDLSDNGRQPMMDLGGNTVIAVNGEIYNFQSLREDLLVSGHRFNSNSDSEVLLHGYEEWGIKVLLDRIEGMFAFVIYDREKRKVFLVRDRVGIKPLYYSWIGSSLAWASELKALSSFHRDHLETDMTALYDFLTYLYIPTPKTCYNNVFKLPPAHYLEYDLQTLSLKCRRYWKLEVTDTPIKLDEASERLRKLIDKAVKEQLLSDVPIGFFLSGGLDSSIIVSAATNATDFVNTYSIGFDDVRHDETSYAGIVAEHFQTRHEKQILTVEGGGQLIANMKTWFDEPFGDTSALPTYLVSQFARKHCTVALTGDGGDELFGGYRFYNRFNGKERTMTSDLRFLKLVTHRVRRKYRSTLAARISNRIIRRLSNEMELHLFLKGGMLREEKLNSGNSGR